MGVTPGSLRRVKHSSVPIDYSYLFSGFGEAKYIGIIVGWVGWVKLIIYCLELRRSVG